MDKTEALQALQISTGRHNVNSLLSSTVGTTFINMVTVTEVKLASPKNNPHTDGVQIVKVCKMTGIVANNLKESTNLYTNKVLKTVQPADNKSDFDDTFVFSGSAYQRAKNSAYSVLELRSNPDKKYLEVFPQSTQGVHYVKFEGDTIETIEKADLEKYLTAGEWKKLNEDKSVVYNVKNDATHSAIYRAYKMESIKIMTINGQTYTGEFYA